MTTKWPVIKMFCERLGSVYRYHMCGFPSLGTLKIFEESLKRRCMNKVASGFISTYYNNANTMEIVYEFQLKQSEVKKYHILILQICESNTDAILNARILNKSVRELCQHRLKYKKNFGINLDGVIIKSWM